MRRVATLFAVLTALWTAAGVQARAGSNTSVLIVHSYGQEYPWTKRQQEGFLRRLEAERPDSFSVVIESLETKRVAYTDEYAQRMAKHLASTFGANEPDVIYVTDDNALMFALSQLVTLYPRAAVFFSGVNDMAVKDRLPPNRVTGVFERKEIRPNLDLIRSFAPLEKKIAVVGDDSETYKAIERDIVSDLLGFPEVEAELISHGRIDCLVQTLRGRRERFVILTTLGAMKDHNGRTLSQSEVIAAIRQAGRYDILTMEDVHLRPGVLGGYVTSGQRQGETAAEMVLRYLGGEPLAAIPPLETSPNEYLFDAQALTRAGFTLPAEVAQRATVLHQPPTFYQRHVELLVQLFYGLAVLFLLGLVAALIVAVRKNRQIAESDARYRLLFEKSADAYCVLDDGLFAECNAALLTLLGAPRDQVIGRSPVWFAPDRQPDGMPSRESIERQIRQASQAGSSRFEWAYCRLDGARLWAEMSLAAMPLAGRTVLLTVWRDVTDRKQAEANLRASEEHLAATLRSIGDGVIATDALGRVTNLNRVAERLTGWTAEAAIRHPIEEVFHIVHSQKGSKVENPIFQALREGTIVELANHTTLIARDGSQRPIADSCAPIRDTAGRVVGAVLVFRDVTDEYRQRAAIRDSEAFQRALLESLPVGVVIVDPQTRHIEQVNNHAATLHGGGVEQLIGQPCHGLICPAERGKCPVCDLGKSVDSADRELVRCDGSRLPILKTVKRVKLKGQEKLLETFVDVSQRIQAETRLQEMVTALESANHALAEASRAAESATRAKSEFLANMSHEIRTPMAAILGFAELLMSESSDELIAADRTEALRAIERNGQHLLGVINDILDLSKVEAGQLEVERVACSTQQILTEAVALMRVRAESKNLSLQLQCAGPIPATIQSDPLRLRQVLINLIGNAIKFTDKGSVRVVAQLMHCDDGRTMLQLEVHDTGIGMTAEQIGRLFKPFCQADTSATRRFGGTGLGLTISKRLAEMLGGDITVRSTPGTGSTFTLAVQTGDIDGATFTTGFGTANSTVGAAKSATCPIQLSGRVLLAEDGIDNQRLIVRLLRCTGAEVEVAENGQTAYGAATTAAAEGDPFDLILMDMHMPVLDGYAATARLRAEGYAGPIIAITANAMSGDEAKCRAAGCDAYLTKPIVRDIFYRTVAEYLRKPSSTAAPDAEAGQPAVCEV